MYEGTPNEEYLDPEIERLREVYGLERLRNWELEELAGLEEKIQVEFLKVKSKFPARESAIQGPVRAFLMDDPNGDKRALTEDEHRRLELVEEELIGNVKQARGLKKQERRSHKETLLDKSIELFQWIVMAAAKIRGRF